MGRDQADRDSTSLTGMTDILTDGLTDRHI